jgi:nicotinamidase-related amidase
MQCSVHAVLKTAELLDGLHVLKTILSNCHNMWHLPICTLSVCQPPGPNCLQELAPAEGEVVIDKPGKGSFCATGATGVDYELVLCTQALLSAVLLFKNGGRNITSCAVLCCADLDLMLRCRGIRNIILAGVTTDV